MEKEKIFHESQYSTQIKVQVNHSTYPSNKPCNLLKAATHVCLDPWRLCGASFVFKHSVMQIRLQAKGLNLFRH